MPCKKCKDGKYKWGNTGECKYATKDECEKANPKNYKEMKQYPTPLGKTYAEYEKELKEFNLSKVERVELQTIKDIKDFAGQAEFNAREGIDIFNEAQKKASSNHKTGIKFAEKGLKMVETFKKSVKELGIDIPKEINQLESSLRRSEKTLNDYWKNVWN
jgi:hypothetical protein